MGAVEYYLNGGLSISVSITGFGSHSSISARLITAIGEPLQVGQSTYIDLLYTIYSAGQLFGLATRLVEKTYPFSDLGKTSESSGWAEYDEQTIVFMRTGLAKVDWVD